MDRKNRLIKRDVICGWPFSQVGIVRHNGDFVYLVSIHTKSSCTPNYSRQEGSDSKNFSALVKQLNANQAKITSAEIFDDLPQLSIRSSDLPTEIWLLG